MSLINVACQDARIETFSYVVTNIHCRPNMKITALEEYKPSNKKSTTLGIILGKIVKILSYSAELQRYIILGKEYLPSNQYGEKFKAIIDGDLAEKLACFSPQTGDRVAFLDPFLYPNPAYESKESKKQPKYLLQARYGDGALMWFAKKEVMKGKSDNDKIVKQAKCPEQSMQHKASGSLRHRTSEPGSSFGQHNDGEPKEQTSDVQRPKPVILLPKRPQIPVNTKRLNPHYKYRTISSVKLSKSPGSSEHSVNLFGVVNKIKKPVSTTKKNKYMLACELMDDSDEKNAMINFYCFTVEDVILKEIEVGDILRLHRVKLEMFNDEIDGRVFFSHDIVVFKKGWPDIKPITNAKNTVISDDEKTRVKNLIDWYTEYLRRPTLLADICGNGVYCVTCKVIKAPEREKNKVIITVTDGSVVSKLDPGTPLRGKGNAAEAKKDTNIVTRILAINNLDKYASLQKNSFVTFYDVEAVEAEGGKYELKITSETTPEILPENSLQASDIKCRIEQFESETQINAAEDDSGMINEILSGQENETTVLTRQQKKKLIISPPKSVAKPVKCDNKSPSKQNSVVTAKEDNDAKTSESDAGTKSRKQLFTPNYMTDLSDAATDETSEHNVEMLKQEVPEENILKPASTDIDEIIKICSSQNQVQKQPFIVLDRCSIPASDGCCNNTDRKRSLNATEPQDDDDDAETVVNHTLKAGFVNRPSRQKNKRKRLESMSTEEGNPRNSYAVKEFESRGQKVSSWLFHPNNKIDIQEDTVNTELDAVVLKRILGCDSQNQDMSNYIHTGCCRLKAFLLDVVPDPLRYPMDLVSGYCFSGCQRMFLYSSIKWFHEETNTIPLCPECAKIEQENELQLTFMMELIIVETTGRHLEVLATRNYAEQFLNCSVSEYVKDEVIRRSRIRLLTDYTMRNTYGSPVTPLLDICVIPLPKIPLLVKTVLKLPRI